MSPTKPIESIVIVGGGTAGWLSAAYLNRALGESVDITVVESSAVGRIGVGEATVPTMVNTIRYLGLDEGEFMRRCNATFKAAIKYENWATGGQGPRPDEFYHPFFDRPETLFQPFAAPHFPFVGEGFTSADYWAHQGESRDPRFDRVCSEIPALSEVSRFGPERMPGSRTLQYAYHLDAGLFAALLCEVAVGRGVKRQIEHIRSVELGERGEVKCLHAESGAVLEADFFLDCSGFRGLIINQALEEPFMDDSKFLACDSAVAISAANHPERDGIPPYTVARAMCAGWSWRVPLFHRFGTGYVYSSAHLSREDAEAELRADLGEDAGEEANHIRMRVGRCRASWVKNCLAVGLSSAFLEPLESTAIFLVEYQLAHFINLFPNARLSEPRIRRYNATLNEMYDHLRDFIVMHYCTTQRGDTPFWRQIRDEMPIPDSLATILEEYRDGVLPMDALRFRLFRARSYAAILSGMGVYPEHGPPILEHVDPAKGTRFMDSIRSRAEEACTRLPEHYAYVRKLHEMEELR